MPAERFFHHHPFTTGQTISLEGQEAHHLTRVMRIQVGEIVELVNGLGDLATGELISIHKQHATLLIKTVFHEEKSGRPLILAQALPRMSHLELIVEKGTELGVTAFWLFPGARSEKKELSSNQISRLSGITIAALKQSGRLYLPEILWHPKLPTKGKEPLLFGDIHSSAPSLLKVVEEKKFSSGVVFVTGPEAGLTEKEVEALRAGGGTGVSLNGNTLRTETASIVACGVLSLAYSTTPL